jgi:predicted ArsR family transcriptional regulator
MLNYIRERQKRRLIILKGISQDLKHSEIANQLGVNRRVVLNDLKIMRYNGDLELKQAQKAQEQIRAKNQSDFTRDKIHAKHNERFLNMTGMTLQEKSFRNMIDFNQHELMKILKSKDQNAAIFELPKSIRRTLMHNGIITKGWNNREITSRARKYLSQHDN